MKKLMILPVMFMLSGCSMWNNWHWDWNTLNPWSEEEPVAEEQKEEATVSLPATVNQYLWKASLDKLAFMGISSQNPQTGRIETNWKTPSGYSNERFKVVSEINDGELRADALRVKVYKEVNGKNGWGKATPSAAFVSSVEQAIINQAKVVYINDKNKD